MSDTLHPVLAAAQLASVRHDGGNAVGMFNTLLIVGITVLVLVRQFTTRQVTPRMYVWVGVLIVRGCVPPGPAEMSAVGIGFLVAALAASAAFGIWRGATVPMWRDGSGAVFRRGDRLTLILWVATVAVRLLLGAIENVAFHTPFNANALWLGMGVTLAVQQVVMTRRGADVPLRESVVPDGEVTRAAR